MGGNRYYFMIKFKINTTYTLVDCINKKLEIKKQPLDEWLRYNCTTNLYYLTAVKMCISGITLS